MQSTRGWEGTAGSPRVWRGTLGGEMETPNFPNLMYGPPYRPPPPLWITRAAVSHATAGADTTCARDEMGAHTDQLPDAALVRIRREAAEQHSWDLEGLHTEAPLRGPRLLLQDRERGARGVQNQAAAPPGGRARVQHRDAHLRPHALRDGLGGARLPALDLHNDLLQELRQSGSDQGCRAHDQVAQSLQTDVADEWEEEKERDFGHMAALELWSISSAFHRFDWHSTRVMQQGSDVENASRTALSVLFYRGVAHRSTAKSGPGNITIVRIFQWDCMPCGCAVPLNVCTYSFHCVSALWWYARPSPFLVLYKCSNFIGNSNPPPPKKTFDIYASEMTGQWKEGLGVGGGGALWKGHGTKPFKPTRALLAHPSPSVPRF